MADHYYENYFSSRNVSPEDYESYRLPLYLIGVLPVSRQANILDIGCGFGQTLNALRQKGYHNLCGIDISKEAVSFCVSKGLSVELIDDLEGYVRNNTGFKYDLIIMSHVLEHIPKERIIPVVKAIKEHLLASKGSLLVMVPNAQSNTGCYWAYEDFTHTVLFTAGSIGFCLKSAGFRDVNFLDPCGTRELNVFLRMLRIVLLEIYRMNQVFWNKVTSSSFHESSPRIFSYELKVLAKNDG